MEEKKKKQIQEIIDTSITEFAKNFEERHKKELNKEKGVINKKKNNVFMPGLGKEFMYYSALIRSFDSSFGNFLEKMGNSIAALSYEVRNKIVSFLSDDQERIIDSIISKYNTDAAHRIKPLSSHYKDAGYIIPRNIESYKREHKTDHYFYDKVNKKHYLIELKAGGDLDSKKAPSEKRELLKEYFMVKNVVSPEEEVKIFFCAAYNKNGEENLWKQSFVESCFSKDELLIGKDYWNFVCNDSDGFSVVLEQYQISAIKIQQALDTIKALYFPKE